MDDYILKRLHRLLSVMSAMELAQRLEVSPRVIYKWLYDPTKMRVHNLMAIKKLHVEMRSRIQWKEKQERMNAI